MLQNFISSLEKDLFGIFKKPGLAYITVPIFGSAKLFQICSKNLSFLEGKQIYNTLLSGVHGRRLTGNSALIAHLSVDLEKAFGWKGGSFLEWDSLPNKTYTLKQDQLVPTVLIHGTGC